MTVRPGPPAPGAPDAAPDAALDSILARLRAAGGRVTATRRATIEALLAGGDRHVSAEQIAEAVRSRHPEVAESTVYRTLTTLEDLGVVAHVHLGHGPATFHLEEDGHRHLVCRDCHAVIEVPSSRFARLIAGLRDDYGFEVSDEHFALSGLCRSCAGAGAGRGPAGLPPGGGPSE